MAETPRQGRTVASSPGVMWMAPVSSSLTSQTLPPLAPMSGEDKYIKRTEANVVCILYSAHTLAVWSGKFGLVLLMVLVSLILFVCLWVLFVCCRCFH